MSSGEPRMSCFKCGEMGHWARNCLAYSSKQPHTTQSRHKAPISCTRCGRIGHSLQDCFARSTVDGQSLQAGGHTGAAKMYRGPVSGINNKGQVSGKYEGQGPPKRKRQVPKRSGVYVLQYQDGNIYVGKSNDIDARIRQHASRSVQCTSGWQGSPREIQPITPSLDDYESWERNETLERMSQHGVEKVRGWMYTSLHLSEETIESIDAQLCEKYDLCRLCGMKGHFASACPKENYSKPQNKKMYGGGYKDGSVEEYSDDSSFFSESSEGYDCFSDHDDGTGHFKRYHGNPGSNSSDCGDSYDDGEDEEFEEFSD